jgi:hypothetical protein
MALPGFTAGSVFERSRGGGIFTGGGGLNVPPGCICTNAVLVCGIFWLCVLGVCLPLPLCWVECTAFICGEPA